MKATMGLAGLLLLGACAYSYDETVEVAPETGAPAGVAAPTQADIDQSVERLRAELTQLQAMVSDQTKQLDALRVRSVESAETYQDLVASIAAALDAGAAPGDPALTEQWSEAEAQLDLIDDQLAQIDALSTGLAQGASRAVYLQDQLRILDDETAATALRVDQLQIDTAQSIAQQGNYLGTERANLQALAQAIDAGEPYVAVASEAEPVSTMVGAPGSGIATGRPLVVIRFETEAVDYEPALLSAVSAALDRRPNAAFDVAAVSPAGGNDEQIAASVAEARRHADDVLRSLAGMGLTGERVSVTSVISPDVQVNEVHVFVR